MTRGRTHHPRPLRLTVAVLLAITLVAVGVAPSIADPADQVRATKAQLDNARAKLEALNQKFTQLVEEYDFARVQLAETQAKLDDAQAIVDRATNAATAARSALNSRTSAAYQGTTGTALDMLLGSRDFSDFADRLEFLNEMAAHDADLASQAQVTGEEAARAAEALTALKLDQEEHKAELEKAKDEISKNIDEQQKIVSKYQLEYQQALAAQRAAEQAAAEAAAAATTSSSSGGSGYTPPTSSGAAGAVEAALSMQGKPYVWGAADPDVGFDCSGLTMWAWAQVGVSLPHSSSAQYSAVPHVSRDQLQPGDLLFFYSPISHVAMYIGGNQMVHASHPGEPVAVVTIADYWWEEFAGAGRPG